MDNQSLNAPARKSVLVFDIDDTISIHKNRDYVNAIPIQPVIDKLNELHDRGYYIKLFTGRGQLSCKGNLALIIERNQAVLEDWLKRHNVKYDELIFGKPLGDWYIDDKGMDVDDFLKAEFCELKGGSNSKIYREHNKVIKISKTSQAQYAWYKEAAKLGISIPRIYSCVGDTLYMQYMDGQSLADCCTSKDIEELVNLCYLFSRIDTSDSQFDCDAYCTNLVKHYDTELTSKVIADINSLRGVICEKTSFYHGDLTLSNIIKQNGTNYVIDPNYRKEFCSYLLDLSKIRQSLHDYEFLFGFSKAKNSVFLKKFDDMIKPEDLQLVRLLEVTHWIRMYDYKPENERPVVENMMRSLYEEYEREYKQ